LSADRFGSLIRVLDEQGHFELQLSNYEATMLEFQGVTKKFGEVTALDQISFKVGSGRITFFVGPNGSGKTTALRILVGLAEPSCGAATIDGRKYRELDRPLHSIGVLFDGGFHPGRSARDHLRVMAAAANVDRGRIETVLAFVGLKQAATRSVGGFSTGMRQRLRLAGAMLADPPVLILDEPLNGLDPEGIRWLRESLRDFAREGRTIFVSSHILAEAEELADDIVIVSAGKVKAATSMAELATSVGAEVRVSTPQAQHARRLLSDRGYSIVESQRPDSFNVRAPSHEVGEVLGKAGIILHELAPLTTQLESIYFELVVSSTRSGANNVGLE